MIRKAAEAAGQLDLSAEAFVAVVEGIAADKQEVDILFDADVDQATPGDHGGIAGRGEPVIGNRTGSGKLMVDPQAGRLQKAQGATQRGFVRTDLFGTVRCVGRISGCRAPLR
mgnify:CR=1 FL=1